MKLPTVEFKGKVFIWDSRLKEFRPEKVDLNWISLKVNNSLSEIMDSAVYNNDLKTQKLVLLDALDNNDSRGLLK
jgi:hypothetical protein